MDLGQSILFGAYRDSLPVAVFSAYFDASGTKDSRILTVAGFVSRVSKWNKFDEQWGKILRREHVTSMHMTDFASSKGEFTEWKGQTEKRQRFVADLVECIRKNTNKGFASSLILPDYREINANFQFDEYVGHPFTLCTRNCLAALKTWARRKNIDTER